MRDILPTTAAWLEAGQPVAVATVVRTWGSAPRQIGAKLSITPSHHMAGSVSGGCVEGTVIDEALAALADYTPRLLHFGVADDTAWDVGLACGGEIDIYVEPLDPELFGLLRAHLDTETSCTQFTIISGDAIGTKLVTDAGIILYAVGDPDALDALIMAAYSPHETGRVTLGDYDVFIETIQPRPHLIMIGGAHIAIPLTQMAETLGFRVSLIDPRRAFANSDRFPSLTGRIYHDYPDKSLPPLGLDAHTYLVVLSHDPKIDDPALRVALNNPVAYVGVLSSRKTHAERVKRLAAAGLSTEQLARIHTPIGLDINGRTPEEIALSIMAEIVAVKNRPPTP